MRQRARLSAQPLGPTEIRVTDKLDRYSQELQSLIGEAVFCTPESWDEGCLTIECDGSYMTYALKNERSDEKAQISAALRQLCEDFYVVMRKSGDWWIAASIRFFRKDERWSFEVKFSYPPKAEGSRAPSESPGSAPKPWWRIWQ